MKKTNLNQEAALFFLAAGAAGLAFLTQGCDPYTADARLGIHLTVQNPDRTPLAFAPLEACLVRPHSGAFFACRQVQTAADGSAQMSFDVDYDALDEDFKLGATLVVDYPQGMASSPLSDGQIEQLKSQCRQDPKNSLHVCNASIEQTVVAAPGTPSPELCTHFSINADWGGKTSSITGDPLEDRFYFWLGDGRKIQTLSLLVALNSNAYGVLDRLSAEGSDDRFACFASVKIRDSSDLQWHFVHSMRLP